MKREMVRLERPRRVWAEDGHVLLEAHDGAVLVMTPEIAIQISELIGNAGSQALLNRLRDGTRPIDVED